MKSATLGLPGTREERILMDADHNTICKFESAGGSDYENVISNLLPLAEYAVASKGERKALQARYHEFDLNASRKLFSGFPRIPRVTLEATSARPTPFPPWCRFRGRELTARLQSIVAVHGLNPTGIESHAETT